MPPVLDILVALLLVTVPLAAFYLVRRIFALERLVAHLTARVYELEGRAEPPPAPEPEVPMAAAPAPVAATNAYAEPPPFSEPTRDWESIIGGNWLNKIGALVLVVGIGLFLTYSLAHLGPAGKVGIGFAVGLSMLAAGLVLEQREGYQVFSRGLIGGGWAAVYFTTYATHGLPAARVIDSATLGTALLLAVAALMLLHSFRYRSEPATVLAYFISFATINITPLSPFTLVASLLLALSLAYAAHAFAWRRLAVTGILFTYGTFALGYEPEVYGRSGLLNGQSLVWIYWIVFESYDLLELARRGHPQGLGRSLFLLNLAGFTGATVLHEWNMGARDWSVYFAIAALAYAASAVIRLRVAAPADESSAGEALSGGYEAAAAASAAMAAAAIVERFTGWRMTLALALEGEMVALAGIILRNRNLRGIGAAVLGLAVLHLSVDAATGERWTPTAVALAVAFYANHLLLRAGWLYPAAGSVLLLFASGRELPEAWVAPAWTVGLLALVLLGRRMSRLDLLWQAYALSVLVAFAVLALRSTIPDSFARRAGSGAAILGLFAAHVMLARNRWIAPMAGAVLAATLEYEVPSRFVTVAWGGAAVALVAAGFHLYDRVLRFTGLGVLLLCIGRLFLYDLRQLDTFSRILSFIVLGLLLLGASWVYTRYREQIRRIL